MSEETEAEEKENIEDTGEGVEPKGSKNTTSYLFKIENRDVEDMKTMSKMIGKELKLKKASPSYVARFMMEETLKGYRKEGLI